MTLFLARPGAAQTYRFRIYGTDDGLGNLAVTCLAQDGEGYLWAGSLNGLYRYDGDKFERFGPAQGLTGNSMVSLMVTPAGSLWVGTESGVALWQSGRFRSVQFGEDISLGSPSSLAVEPRTGHVWVATRKGIFRIERDAMRAEPLRASFVNYLPRGVYSGIAFGVDGTIWAATSETVYRWKKGELSQGSELGIPKENWQAILVDGHGKLWVRSLSRLLSLKSGDSRFLNEDRGLPDAEIPALGLDPKGEILVPTILGLARRSGNKWQIIGRHNGLPMESVSAAIFDREGSPWIGTNGGGVARWLGFGAWEAWTAPDWMDNDAIWAIAEDRGGGIWIGSNTGVLYLPSNYQAASTKPKRRFQIRAPVHTLALGPQNELWVGTNHAGLFRCKITFPSCSFYGSEAGIPDRDISDLVFDSKGVLWVTTSTGAYWARVDAASVRFAKVSLPEGGLNAHISRIGRDHDGKILIALGNTLWMQKSGSWNKIELSGLVPDQQIGQIIMDRSGTIWLSYGHSLGVTAITGILTNRSTARHYDLSSGLGSNFVYALTSDAQGRVFVGTDSGIDMLDDGKWRHYGAAEGLIWNDLNSSALFTDSRGGVWVGTSRGLSRFQPDREYRSMMGPLPIITSVQMLGRAQNFAGPVEIPYRNRDIAIRFSALSFAHEAGMHFQYRLLGLVDAWTSSRDRDVRLVNLPPGSYTLEVSARRSDGLTSAEPARLKLVVATPWWRTYTFYLISGLVLVGLCRAVWWRRMRLLLLSQKELEEAVQRRTGELMVEQGHLLEAREALREQATRDPLTKLLNRRAFFEALERCTQQAIRSGQHLAVVMADMDHFKSINDRYGHQAGDSVLVAIAERFSSAIRSYDAVGRYGGEELILVFSNCNQVEAAGRAEDLRRDIESLPIAIGLESLRVTCSFGISAAGHRDIVPDNLIAAADSALYRAKRKGRNRVVSWDAEWKQDESAVPEQAAVFQ